MNQASVCSGLTWLIVFRLWAGGSSAFGAADRDAVDYATQIKPLLAEKCYSCHGATRQEAGLRLETRELLLQGGDSGPVIAENSAEESLLLQRVSSSDPDVRMPPEGEGSALSAEQLQLLRRWINAGAKAPLEEIPPSPSQHWAFQPVVRPDIPDGSTAQSSDVAPGATASPGGAGMHPIDALITAGYQQRQLKPVVLASPEILQRRVFLDLTGLPPTAEQRRQFLNDTSEDAYERLVDELLASPLYGQRWGRHWMDIWRYSDWYGLGAQLRNSQKHLWHWRDWIVESLNADTGYDQMLREMLAADELYPTDPEKLRATGFLARHYYLFNRTTWLDDTIEHTSKAFLGLTMNCVKCHTHKYDPITHEEYYAMRAFFEPYQVRLDSLPGQIDLEKDGLPRVFDAHPDAPTFLHVRGDEKNPDTSKSIAPRVPAILTTANVSMAPLTIEPVTLPVTAYNPALRPFILDDHLQNATASIKSAQAAVLRATERLKEIRTVSSQAAGRDSGSAVFIDDQFDSMNNEVWETGPGEWSVRDGQLVQAATGASRAYLRTRSDHPQDFLATLRFTTTGGNKWRSVGLAFDVTGTQPGVAGEGPGEKMVYLSAVSPGSKLQVSYKTSGAQSYPPRAARAMPVSLQTPYEMTIAVRGQLVNVGLNGEHRIAWQCPVPRETGVMDLVAFDATVQFDSLTVRELSSADELIPATESGADPLPLTIDAAQHALDIARLQLAVAEAYPAVVRTAFAADRAREEASEAELQPLVAAAARAARIHELAQAELKSAQAAEKPDDVKALKAAAKALAAAKAAVNEPGDSYPSLTASLKAPEGPDEKDEVRRQPYPRVSTGRRAALARWMTDRQNPLTARVAVNHLWLRHFGQPLVDSETDFGLRAPRPVQHALLDWLAAELMENNWSMKHIHRLIVTSRTWQLSTSTLECDPATLERDPENQYYWRHRPVRMESQVVRDSLLHLAGVLDTTPGGPSLDPAAKTTVYRRSLYFRHSRDDQDEFLAMFDDADILRCYRRSESVVPQQALALANSELALQMARKIAANLTASLPETSTDEEFLQAAFGLILGRMPTDAEIAACFEAIAQTRNLLTDQPADQVTRRIRENLVHAFINHNDFITVR